MATTREEVESALVEFLGCIGELGQGKPSEDRTQDSVEFYENDFPALHGARADTFAALQILTEDAGLDVIMPNGDEFRVTIKRIGRGR